MTILKLAEVKFSESKFILFWIFFNLFLVGEKFALTSFWMIWLTGACNYLWTTFFQLAFLLLYVRTIQTGKIETSKLKIIFYAVLGILAGWSTEAGSLATICLTAFLIFLLKRKNFLSVSAVIGFCFLIFGCVMNISAPGNFVQLEFIQSVNPVEFTYSKEFFMKHFETGFIPLGLIDLFVLLPTIFYFFKKNSAPLNTKEILMIAFAVTGFLIPLAMMFSPKFSLRIALNSMAFILVSSALALNELKFYTKKISQKIFAVANLILILYFSTTVCLCYFVDKNYSEQLNYIEAHKNEEIVIMKKMPDLPKFLVKINNEDIAKSQRYFGGIIEKENYCLNVMISNYYGLKKIVAEH